MVAVEPFSATLGDQHLVVERVHWIVLQDALQQASPDPQPLPVRVHQDVGDVDREGTVGHGARIPHDRSVVGTGHE